MNSASGQADRCPGQRLFQPCLPLALRNGPVKDRQQRLDLAEFRRPLVTGPVNRALEQPKPDFLGQTGKGASVESEARGIIAISQGEIALGTVGQHFDRGIRPRQPCCQPRQISAIAALVRQLVA